MSEKPLAPHLESNATDYVTSAAKALLGGVPFVGSLLTELAGSVIPNQRTDRIVRFAQLLEQRIEGLDRELVRAKLRDENFSDLMEESVRQAASAVSEERKKYIVELLARSISAANVDFIESKHLLRLLTSINDIEAVWLRYYLVQTMDGDVEFRDKHKNILEPKSANLGSNTQELDQSALQQSYKEHLVQLGLLRHRYRIDQKTKMPEIDRNGLKVSGYDITPLGRLLLREIGLAEQSE